MFSEENVLFRTEISAIKSVSHGNEVAAFCQVHRVLVSVFDDEEWSGEASRHAIESAKGPKKGISA